MNRFRMDDRVHRLTENLQGTTRNLRSLDRMLDDYRDVGREQRSAVDRLRDDVVRTQDQLRAERLRSPINRDYGSDSEYESSPRRQRRRRRSTVRFADDMNRELHGIHQSVRDLSSDHLRLEDSFNREVDRRDRFDYDTRRTMKEISDNLKRLPQTDPTAVRVEKRLAAIQNELRSDRYALDRHDELHNLSTELRSALSAHQNFMSGQASALDDRLRNQYYSTEAAKHKIESELEGVKRKLDQSEGGKVALQQQVEDLRSQLNRMEQERVRLKMQMDDNRYEDEMKDRRKRQLMEEEKEKDRRHMEKEIAELRGQLARSLSANTEIEELRRGIERSERQRAQLSDHIETLTKDLENREKQTAKLITELKETTDKFEEADRQKIQLGAQHEENTKRLTDTNKELEKTTNELRNTQVALHAAEKKKEEFKGRAQETVRQWKMKVKQLEREVDRHRHGGNQVMQRNEQLVKDLEVHRQQIHHQGIQMENLKRELGDALAVRAAQDEQIRLKDVEINELKSVRMDLDRELRDCRTVADRMENELHSTNSRLATVTEDKNKLEDRLSSIEAAHMLSQDQANQLQQEIKELSSLKAEFAGQLSEANGKLHERENRSANMDGLKRELNEVKVREAHVMQDINRKMKREKAEYEATIQALKTQMAESDISRVKHAEEELFATQNELKRVGELFDTAAVVKGTPNGPSASITDIKSKMKWLRGLLRDKIKHEQKLRQDLREALTCSDSDRNFLLSELAKREEVLDELSIAKQELAMREVDNVVAVEKLQEQILDLTDELELRKIREEEIAKTYEADTQHIIDEMEDLKFVNDNFSTFLKDVREEKAKIEERYVRLQETMRALQDEIKCANLSGLKIEEMERNIHNMRRRSSPKKNHRVRIQENPKKRPHTPPSKLVEA
ncbi:hypothetical protein KUTeg_012964 [Tegillarca granosa]|uniref:Uncharacterized protein n=1 Tax=Tegillarca granosa TaxID=220873 RepID=A0ABQ9ESD7_TEGGR|nr:hypothetical protein KUTeg_012964 [Tegillarca granosa]